MTNKPMLSVELRKALADFIEYSVPGPYGADEKWYSDKQALRTLLDKPVCHNCAGLERNIPCPECKPAAQPQGEVERLRAELRSAPLREALLEQVKGERDRMIERTIELSAQVDDRDSVLREVADLDPRGELLGWQLDGKIDAILSTSAEPKPRGEQVGMLLIDEYFDNLEVGDVDVQLDKEVCGRLAQSHPGQSLAIYVELPAPVADHTQCEECKGWGYHENYYEGGGTECGECGGSGKAPVAVFMPDVDELAQIIRKFNGSHTLGAGSLAEAILEEVARLNVVKI